MNYRAGTAFFLAALVLAIAIYDVVILWRGGARATISSVILGAIYTPPYGALVVFALGVLCGHLIWPQRNP